MATVYKIHPAIGIARVGNSPDEFFIGPERIGEHPTPAGGFKDAQCRVKRQAARFRIFAHHDDGTVEEITDAEAEITWTVHLVNKKAAQPRPRQHETAGDLTIDPGSRTLNGPNQRKLFDTGTIEFADADPAHGAARRNPQRRRESSARTRRIRQVGLAAGNRYRRHFWTKTTGTTTSSDGPVSATITIPREQLVSGRGRGLGHRRAAEVRAAPGQRHQLCTTACSRQWSTRDWSPQPTTTSYTNDIYPILQRARDTRWVESTARRTRGPTRSPARRCGTRSSAG